MHTSQSFAGPLTPQIFHILLALADGPRHGYGIMIQATEDSGGTVILEPGTVYTALARLKREKLITLTERDWAETPGKPRRYYQMTEQGRTRLRLEVDRLKRAAVLGNQKLYGRTSYHVK